jgi:hypothetical protein
LLIPAGINNLKNNNEIEKGFHTLVNVIPNHPLRQWRDRVKGLGDKRFFSHVAASGTVIELCGKQNSSERTIKFLKLRNGPPHLDIYLKRDGNLIYQVVDEKSKCPPRKVVEILKTDFGGDCPKKGLWVDKICQQVGCSESTAKKGIDKAEAKGMIKQTEIGRSIRIQVRNK